MKKVIIASLVTVIATSTFASEFETREMFKDSSIQTVARVFADLFEATSIVTSLESTEHSSYEHKKLEALKIQNDIQNYSASGNMSVYLSEKINIVNTIDASLSQEEALDVLIIASNKILEL